MPSAEIKQVPIGKLRPHPANAHTHSKKQIAQIARSIREFGFTNYIVSDDKGVILAGHGRLYAAKQNGLSHVPVIVVSGLSDAQRRAYLLADNKLTENAGWDRTKLATELDELTPLLQDAGLDIDITGFEPAEIDKLLTELVDPEVDPGDELPQIEHSAISRRGDIWTLGPHKLGCGDAKSDGDFRTLIGRDRAAAVFTDPPYNVRVRSVQGRGRIRHSEFLEASGEMSAEKFTAFLRDTLTLAAKYSLPGAVHFVCMDWRHLSELATAGTNVYGAFLNLIVWCKSNAGQGSFYRSQHELVFVFRVGGAKHLNNVKLGHHGRNRSNVWHYAGVNSFRPGRLDDLSMHPTLKPIAMVADAMRDCTRRDDIVLDPFAGSGTSIMAAERVGRRGFGLEIDPRYVDVAIRRWEAFTKRDAILRGTGKTFSEVTDARRRGTRS